ncbi:hypothetical protein [Streptomonospora nanhaiensis]|uniref:hypothetical protein n=1 Tax=Streptomonospora nanhaiensis TaxID=1323731 RepID=UPI001C38EC90|nr:hypothetical protein [Streptomonospora nanhaiensis]MBV2363209.1 hypothetical protein [Streptomonospora nanhaiensis]
MRKHHKRWIALAGAAAVSAAGLTAGGGAASADERPLPWPMVRQSVSTYSLDGFEIGYLPPGLENHGIHAKSTVGLNGDRRSEIAWVQGLDAIYGRVSVLRGDDLADLDEVRATRYDHLEDSALQRAEVNGTDAYASPKTGDVFWVPEPGVAVAAYLQPDRWDEDELFDFAEGVRPRPNPWESPRPDQPAQEDSPEQDGAAENGTAEQDDAAEQEPAALPGEPQEPAKPAEPTPPAEPAGPDRPGKDEQPGQDAPEAQADGRQDAPRPDAEQRPDRPEPAAASASDGGEQAAQDPQEPAQADTPADAPTGTAADGGSPAAEPQDVPSVSVLDVRTCLTEELLPQGSPVRPADAAVDDGAVLRLWQAADAQTRTEKSEECATRFQIETWQISQVISEVEERLAEAGVEVSAAPEPAADQTGAPAEESGRDTGLVASLVDTLGLALPGTSARE